MLILTRKRNESIVIIDPDGTEVASIRVVNIHDDQVRIGVHADRKLRIRRKGRSGQFEEYPQPERQEVVDR